MSLVFLIGAQHQKEGLGKTGSTLFSLVLELGVKSVVDHEALMD
jgi:hypothetical protein